MCQNATWSLIVGVAGDVVAHLVEHEREERVGRLADEHAHRVDHVRLVVVLVGALVAVVERELGGGGGGRRGRVRRVIGRQVLDNVEDALEQLVYEVLELGRVRAQLPLVLAEIGAIEERRRAVAQQHVAEHVGQQLQREHTLVRVVRVQAGQNGHN